jgi:hypothetical protein
LRQDGYFQREKLRNKVKNTARTRAQTYANLGFVVIEYQMRSQELQEVEEVLSSLVAVSVRLQWHHMGFLSEDELDGDGSFTSRSSGSSKEENGWIDIPKLVANNSESKKRALNKSSPPDDRLESEKMFHPRGHAAQALVHEVWALLPLCPN